MKSRQVIIEDDLGEPHEQFWCDANNCDDCVLRFQCYTSRSKITVTFPLEEIDDIINKLNEQRWRLRDGSSKYRQARM